MTRYGPLDVLGSIGRSRSYDDLLPHSDELEVGEGLRVRVLRFDGRAFQRVRGGLEAAAG